MEYRKITAIDRSECFGSVEHGLQSHGIRGECISRLKGYGESTNLYLDDWLLGHPRVEIFTTVDKTHAIIDIIMNTAHTGVAGDGIVAVLPVERIYRIRTKQPAQPEEL